MINRLEEIYAKRGESYVRDILKKRLIISEKLDTSRIQFEKTEGKLKFYNKDNKEIDIVMRTISDVWEPAMLELPILIENANITEGLRFGLSYSPAERPQRIPYSNIPKYILTDVSRRDKNNKVISSLDRSEIEDWAAKLCVGRPPVIFEGHLNDDSIDSLISYSVGNFTRGNENLSSLVSKIFGKTYSREPLIEGIVIESDNILSQIVAYEFDILNESYKRESSNRDIYDLVIISLNSFLNTYKFPFVESYDRDERYINLVCDIFNEYMSRSNFINEGISPECLTPSSFGEKKSSLNRSFIKNEITLKILNDNVINESVFKIFLSALKKKKRPYGLLDESFIDKFNSHVHLIDSFVNSFTGESSLNESVSENISIDAIRNRQSSDIDSMRVISSIQRAFRPANELPEKSTTPCVVYLTNFMPFTNSQLNNIRNMNKQWSCNVVICSASDKKKMRGNKFGVSDELLRAQMKTIRDFEKELVCGYILLESRSLQEIYEYCRPRFEPIALITDMGKKSEMGLQLYFEEEIMGKRLNVEDNFNIGEMENQDELMALRSIEDENFSNFSELVPPYIKNFYNNFVNEYKIWDGKILNQFVNKK